MSDPTKLDFATSVAALMKTIDGQKEQLVMAWLAETGLLPSESVLVQQVSGSSYRIHVERLDLEGVDKHDPLKPTYAQLEAENATLRETIFEIRRVLSR